MLSDNTTTPYCETAPAGTIDEFDVFAISGFIRLNFIYPEPLVALRYPAEPTIMTVPKAAINEHNDRNLVSAMSGRPGSADR